MNIREMPWYERIWSLIPPLGSEINLEMLVVPQNQMAKLSLI